MNKGMMFVGMGFELLAMVLGGVVIGEAVDKVYHTGVFTVPAFIFLFLIGWSVHFGLMIRKYLREMDEEDQ